MNHLIETTPADQHFTERATVNVTSGKEEYGFFTSDFVQTRVCKADPIFLRDAYLTLMVGGHQPNNDEQVYVHLDLSPEQAIALAQVLLNKAAEADAATRESRESDPKGWETGEWLAGHETGQDEEPRPRRYTSVAYGSKQGV